MSQKFFSILLWTTGVHILFLAIAWIQSSSGPENTHYNVGCIKLKPRLSLDPKRLCSSWRGFSWLIDGKTCAGKAPSCCQHSHHKHRKSDPCVGIWHGFESHLAWQTLGRTGHRWTASNWGAPMTDAFPVRPCSWTSRRSQCNRNLASSHEPFWRG